MNDKKESDFFKLAPPVALSAVLIAICSGCHKQEQPTVQKERHVAVVKAVRRRLQSIIELPGNLEAYQDVPLHAKVEGYISWIGVDRGSIVKKGQRLITITAPEVGAKSREAFSRVKGNEARYRQAEAQLSSTCSRLTQARARLDADALTYVRLKEAYDCYPPAVAKNDLDTAFKAVEADQAEVQSLQAEVHSAQNLVASEKQNVRAAAHLHEAMQAMQSYLDMKAPFDGVITERNVHQGSIVSVSPMRNQTVLPLLRLQQISPLRIVVAVPEIGVAGVQLGDRIDFMVPAYPSITFEGIVARPAYALQSDTRTMPVELSYDNRERELEPGMYATIRWPLTRPYDTVFVPRSAVKTNLKGSFVDKIDNGKIERVWVSEGQTMGDLVEILRCQNGTIDQGDSVALKANDELESGTRISAKAASEKDLKNAQRESAAQEGEE